MTTTELIRFVSEDTGIQQKDVHSAVIAAFEAITGAISEGDTVRINNFGTFGTKLREKRECRNPATGEKMMVPEKTVPYFKASTALKEAVN